MGLNGTAVTNTDAVVGPPCNSPAQTRRRHCWFFDLELLEQQLEPDTVFVIRKFRKVNSRSRKDLEYVCEFLSGYLTFDL